jgi:type IV conjugative transfer system lipoprotein TraV
MKTALFLSPVAALVLSGCMTTPAYRCPLDGSEASGRCTSTEQAYKASVGARGVSHDATSVFDLPQNQHLDKKAGSAQPAASQTPYFTGQAANYPAPPGNGAPVFQQPKVFQPWLAPYVDADGNLRSGEYGYFSTPGRWNYGTLRKPGSSSGIFEPARPGDLGFQPVAPAGRQAAPARPASPPANATVPSGSTAQPTQASHTTPQTAITQPYQRLKSE